MSDITYSKRAEELLAAANYAGGSERGDALVLERANVNASLATARAVREVVDVVKHAARVVAEAMPPAASAEKWITWESGGRHEAIAVRHIIRFYEGDGDTTILQSSDSGNVLVPISFGTVAMMVGA